MKNLSQYGSIRSKGSPYIRAASENSNVAVSGEDIRKILSIVEVVDSMLHFLLLDLKHVRKPALLTEAVTAVAFIGAGAETAKEFCHDMTSGRNAFFGDLVFLLETLNGLGAQLATLAMVHSINHWPAGKGVRFLETIEKVAQQLKKSINILDTARARLDPER